MIQALPYFIYQLCLPVHMKASSPWQDGSAGKEGALDGIGASWVCRGDSSSLGIPGWVPAPGPASGLTPARCLAFSATALLFPSQSLRLTSLHFLCHTPVFGCGGAARPLEGEEEKSSCGGGNLEGASTFWLWPCEEGAVAAVTHPGS